MAGNRFRGRQGHVSFRDLGWHRGIGTKGLGILQHPPTADGFEHRIAGAWVGAMIKGGVRDVAVYLKDSEGLSDTNKAIRKELAASLGKHKSPWICAGDWNLPPEALAGSNCPRLVNGVIKAPTDATCNGATYDYFVVHKALESSVVSTIRIEHGGCKPHWPCRLLLRGNARHKAARRLLRPDKVPADLPAGPLPQGREKWEHDDDMNSQQLGAAFRAWYQRSRVVWNALLGTTAEHFDLKFRWEPATGRVACPHAGASPTSSMMRAAAMHIDEMIRLLRRNKPPSDPAITNHVEKLKKITVQHKYKDDVDLKQSVSSWAANVERTLLSADHA